MLLARLAKTSGSGFDDHLAKLARIIWIQFWRKTNLTRVQPAPTSLWIVLNNKICQLRLAPANKKVQDSQRENRLRAVKYAKRSLRMDRDVFETARAVKKTGTGWRFVLWSLFVVLTTSSIPMVRKVLQLSQLTSWWTRPPPRILIDRKLHTGYYSIGQYISNHFDFSIQYYWIWCLRTELLRTWIFTYIFEWYFSCQEFKRNYELTD